MGQSKPRSDDDVGEEFWIEIFGDRWCCNQSNASPSEQAKARAWRPGL